MTSGPPREAFDHVFSLVYEELRRLARHVLHREYGSPVTPTTLVNEVWLKLADKPEIAQTSPLHFRRIAGRAMRQILVDAARRRQAEVHGGGLFPVTFDDALESQQPIRDRDILALDSALDVLSRRSPRQAWLVEARFFGGFTCDECAEMLEVSEATVMREWRSARAWLACEIRHAAGVPAGSLARESEAP